MRLQTNNLVTRIGATLLAAAWGSAGIFAITMSLNAPTPDLAERSFWMGVTFLIATAIAIPVSWLVADLSNIWCIPPRRTPQPRIRLDGEDSVRSDRSRKSHNL